MKLKKLFRNIRGAEIKGSKELEITGLCSNSKLVSPGNLFIAKKGLVDDGVRYISEAIAAGATAVLTDMFDPSRKEIVQIIVPSPSAVEGELAKEFYQDPGSNLFMVAITGTNGKTTTAFLTKYLIDNLVGQSGLIGTIEYIIGKQRYQATRTTPDVVSNQKMLREMCLQNCKAAVMEVTSHALVQGRVDQIEFDIAIFTNLSLDHLDYHHTMDAYAEAKNLLFKNHLRGESDKKNGKTSCAVLNIDSPWAEKISKGCTSRVFTYGLMGDADLKASSISLTSRGTAFTLLFEGASYPCETPLVGRFNIYNVLAAVSAMVAAGHKLEKILPLLKALPPVPGRLQPVPNDLGLQIYVDFAHSDDALQNVLETLSEFKEGKVTTIFGCGGDRDASKRPKMAQVSEQFSDLTIVTSDNPRSEDPEVICRDILKGFNKPDSFAVELDRRRAIEKAIEESNPKDIILIAGKGHEAYQIFAHKTIEFDDERIASEICRQKSLKLSV